MKLTDKDLQKLNSFTYENENVVALNTAMYLNFSHSVLLCKWPKHSVH